MSYIKEKGLLRSELLKLLIKPNPSCENISKSDINRPSTQKRLVETQIWPEIAGHQPLFPALCT